MFLTLSIKPEFQGIDHRREVRNRGQDGVEGCEKGKGALLLSNPRMGGPVWSGKKQEVSQVPAPSVSQIPCDPQSTAPSLEPRNAPLQSPHMAATEQIQTCSGLDSRKRQELCPLYGGRATCPSSCPASHSRGPQASPFLCPMSFNFPLISLN